VPLYGSVVFTKQWAPTARGKGDPARPRRRRRRATYTRPHGVRHLMAGLDLSRDKLYGHVTKRKGRTQFLAFCRYLRSLHPTSVRIAIICDNFSPHRSTRIDSRVADWAAANNVEMAYTPFYGSWLRSSRNSPRCATSPSTAPTTSRTASRAA
jgi:hypothetical protein